MEQQAEQKRQRPNLTFFDVLPNETLEYIANTNTEYTSFDIERKVEFNTHGIYFKLSVGKTFSTTLMVMSYRNKNTEKVLTSDNLTETINRLGLLLQAAKRDEPYHFEQQYGDHCIDYSPDNIHIQVSYHHYSIEVTPVSRKSFIEFVTKYIDLLKQILTE